MALYMTEYPGKWTEHLLGSQVCAPGHRYPLTVVGFDDPPPNGNPVENRADVYHLADERGSVQPYPGVTIPASDVKAYRWEELLTLSVIGGDHHPRYNLWLDTRAKFLDACALLHDLGDYDNADELLNEAAVAWWKDCEDCGGEGSTSRVLGWADHAVRVGTAQHGDVVSWPCEACEGVGHISRITDIQRLRLVECLIEGGLPERMRVNFLADGTTEYFGQTEPVTPSVTQDPVDGSWTVVGELHMGQPEREPSPLLTQTPLREQGWLRRAVQGAEVVFGVSDSALPPNDRVFSNRHVVQPGGTVHTELSDAFGGSLLMRVDYVRVVSDAEVHTSLHIGSRGRVQVGLGITRYTPAVSVDRVHIHNPGTTPATVTITLLGTTS